MSENANLPSLWQPSPFKGDDLLPVQALTSPIRESSGSLKNVDAKDIVLPKLQLLQGMSKPVSEGIPGASPGKFYLSSTDEVFDGPIRALILFYYKSRALYPDERKPEMAGLESCFSRDAFIGSRYGDCLSCEHAEWRGEKGARKAPLCTESHNFVMLTKNGPALLRVSGTSYKAGSKLVSGLRNDLTRPELWDYPCIIKSVKESTWYRLDLLLDRKDPTPSHVRSVAAKFHEDISASHGSDRLREADTTETNKDSATDFDADTVPF